jgi:phenylalanyl-tRNA synthetase beta chain
MLTSTAWINDYLDRPAPPQEQADLLTAAGFPLEDTLVVGDDVRQDFEMTSNRGDCTCHTGLAREIAAASNRTLVMPDCTVQSDGPPIDVRVDNLAHDACPRYTARVIRNITIGDSPDHVRRRLEARGDVPRNNVVDATNFVLFELGQPTHAFDLDTLEGGRIEIRMARKGERFLPLGDGAEELELNGTELVIADAAKPVALAGVKGGVACAVTSDTKNLLIEAATFDPVAVRHTSRLHNIQSDSSFRFERGVSPLQIDTAASRLCSLILESAGGTLDDGVVDTGAPLPERVQVSMRLQRCRDLLGLDLETSAIEGSLERLGFQPTIDGEYVHCTVPAHRGDIHREVDLIEEVMRMHGFDNVPVRTSIDVTPVMEPADARRRRLMADALVAEGYLETVTHTLTSEAVATELLGGAAPLHVDASRAMADGALRPSLLTSLLKVRRFNADHGSSGQHGMRLFELGSSFTPGAQPEEALELCLLADETDEGIRPIRSAVDQVARTLVGHGADVRVEAGGAPDWIDPGGIIVLNGEPLGWLGRVKPSLQEAAGLDTGTLCTAVLRPGPWMHAAIADTDALAPPVYPSIERDISAIVPEDTSWTTLSDVINALNLDMHQATNFVTVYRGKGIAEGHKSVSLRLCFRAPDRTLTREEVEGPVQSAIDALTSTLGAEVRS